MRIGNKTLLFGCHQLVIHPLYTYIAWRKLYNEFPTFGETIAIIIHDWGYFGKSDLDGEEGDTHPKWAHDFFQKICHIYTKVPTKYYSNDRYLYYDYLSNLCLYHSRFYAKKYGIAPSKLCWADKYGTVLYGKYLWSLLATMGGEAKEYMANPRYETYYTFEEHCELIIPEIEENVEKLKGIQNENRK